MKSDLKEIEINGVSYVQKGAESPIAEKLDGMEYVIVRTYSAGVHAGYLKSKEGKEVVLKRSRRIYQWYGAATLSQLAVDGTSKPKECKFPCEVEVLVLTEAIEVITCTEAAKKSIQGVKVWAE